MDTNIPLSYYLHITERCNYSCHYCYNRKNVLRPVFNKELKTDKWIRFFQELMIFLPEKISLTGGEPLLRKDLKDLAKNLHRISEGIASVSLNTNGSLISDDNAGWLVEYFNEISISIDSFQGINDRFRGEGAFDRAVAAITAVKSAGCSPSVSITRTSLNAAHIEEFITYMQLEWGIRSFRINDVKLIGQATNKPGLHPGTFSCERKSEEVNIPDISCFAGKACLGRTLSILPNGDCYPCHYLQDSPYYLGNVSKIPLDEVFRRIETLRNRFTA